MNPNLLHILSATVILAGTAFLASCDPAPAPAPSDEGKPAPETAPPVPPAADADPAAAAAPAADASYVGMTEEAAGSAADKAGVRWRVVEVDGEPRAVTKDFRPDRLNFVLEAGKIIRVTRG